MSVDSVYAFLDEGPRALAGSEWSAFGSSHNALSISAEFNVHLKNALDNANIPYMISDGQLIIEDELGIETVSTELWKLASTISCMAKLSNYLLLSESQVKNALLLSILSFRGFHANNPVYAENVYIEKSRLYFDQEQVHANIRRVWWGDSHPKINNTDDSFDDFWIC